MYDLLKKIFIVFITLGVILSVFGVIYIEGQVMGIKTDLVQSVSQPVFNESQPTPSIVYLTPSPQTTISKLSTVMITPTPRVIYQSPAPKVNTSYIPLGGTFSTTSTNWVDVPNDQVTFDLVKDYGSSAKASWEAFLKVDNANGEAHVRLYDVIHGIAVDGSELSVVNVSDFTNVGSGNLNFWSGRNQYRVQMKSLNGFTVYLDSARIRISY